MTLRCALTLALLLLVPATSGCGAMLIQHGDVEQAVWPPTIDTPLDERPTALVRLVPPLGDADDDTQSADDLIATFRAPFSAGLFSSVSYQVGIDHMATRADVVLDITITEVEEGMNPLAIIGCATLGILPIPLTEEHTARIRVRDGDGQLLGDVEATDRQTTVIWLPLSPVNMSVGFLVPVGIGGVLGLNVHTFGELERAFTENLVRVALLRAHERFRFRRPARAAPPSGEAAALESG